MSILPGSFKSASHAADSAGSLNSRDLERYMEERLTLALGNVDINAVTKLAAGGVLQKLVQIINDDIPDFDNDGQHLFAQLLRNEVGSIQGKLIDPSTALATLKCLGEHGKFYGATLEIDCRAEPA